MSLRHACPKWHTERFPCHAAVGAVPNFFCLVTLPNQRLYIVKNMCIYTHIWQRSDCIWITVATKQHCERNTFTQIVSLAKCWLNVYHWGAGLSVTGRIRGIGQNVLESYFQTRSSGTPSYFHGFFPIAFLDEDFIRNVIILLYLNYITVIFINNSSAINNNCGRVQDLTLIFKTPMDTCCRKGSPALL